MPLTDEQEAAVKQIQREWKKPSPKPVPVSYTHLDVYKRQVLPEISLHRSTVHSALNPQQEHITLQLQILLLKMCIRDSLSICSNNYDLRIDFFQNLQKFRVISHFLQMCIRDRSP